MKSGLQADAQGFLIGEVIENGRDIMRAQQQSMVIWKTIRTDVKAIARAVGAQVSNNIRVSRPGAAPRAPSVSSTRTLGGNYVGGRPAVAKPVGRSAPAQRAAVARTSVVVAQPRAANGRFVAGARPGGGPGGAGGGSASGGDSTSRMFGRMNDTLGKVASSLQAVDNVDPALNAAKEIRDVVSPLGRGLFSLFGRSAERKKEAWYRKFLKALTPGTQKAQQQANGGGFFGMGGGGAGSLLGGLLGGTGGGVLGGLLGRGRRLLKGGGKLLKRIPFLGALISGGSALWSAFGGNDDPNATPEENRKRRYHNTGEAVGMGVGGAVGAAAGSLLGPVGTLVGGVVGAWLGEKAGGVMGEWTKTLVDSDIPGKVVEGWKATTAFIGAAWESIAADAKTAWGAVTTKAGEWLDAAKSGIESVGKTLSDTGNAMNEWVKAKTGIDVKANVGKAVDKAGEVAGAAWDKTKSAASAGWPAAKGYGAEAVDAAKAGAAAMVPNTVKRAYKAGVAATGTVMQAGGNAALVLKEGVAAGMGPKELANFMGQNAHESGNFGVLSENLNYSSVARIRATFGKNKAIAGMSDAEVAGLVNNPEALANLVYGGRMGNTEAGDGFKFRGRGFTQLTGRANYTAAGKALGLDLVNNPNLAADPANAARISAWYWKKNVAARGAGEDVTAATKAINGGLNGLSDRQKKIAEWEARVNAGSAATPVQVASVSLPPPAPLRIPSPVPANIPKMIEVKEPAMPLNGASGGYGSISIRTPEVVGQNVSDRGIAHVVTGGIGGGVTGGWKG